MLLVVLIQEAVGDTLLQYQPSQTCSGRTPIISNQRFHNRGIINAVYLNVLSDASMRVFVSLCLTIIKNVYVVNTICLFSANEPPMSLAQ